MEICAERLETFVTEDNLVSKFVHSDDSETAIKLVSSCDTIRNPVTGQLEHNHVDRNKFSIFVSSSTGCVMSCKFCYLTIKGMKYRKLSAESILCNLKDAVQAQADINPDIRSRFVKVNWMGMGEDHMLRPTETSDVTLEFLNWLIREGYAAGLDGVDIATAMPTMKTADWVGEFAALNTALSSFPLNPNNHLMVHGQSITGLDVYQQRSPLRLFYSLHAADQTVRDMLIPRSLPIGESIERLLSFSPDDTPNVIFHLVFLDGVNDSPTDLSALRDLVSKHQLANREFRVLRYNSCQNTPYVESVNFDEIVSNLSSWLPKLKVQISTGSEVRAACGQFLVRQFTPICEQIDATQATSV